MSKERARLQKERRRARELHKPVPPRWKFGLFTFGLMLVVMGILRSVQKGEEFGFSDIGFVIAFAAAMGLIAYFRPRIFN